MIFLNIKLKKKYLIIKIKTNKQIKIINQQNSEWTFNDVWTFNKQKSIVFILNTGYQIIYMFSIVKRKYYCVLQWRIS